MLLRQTALLAALTTGIAAPALAELALTSTVDGLTLVALDTLPAAPANQGEAEFCVNLASTSPETPAGRAVQANGWQVTAELPFGDLTAVSFVGGAIPATSGTCELLDGNVGLFSDGQLVALLYGTDPAMPLIGRIEPFGKADLRIWSGDIVPMAVADLQRVGDGITTSPLAAEEAVCNGAATVPNIFNLPIDEARTRLIGAGWEPVPGDPAQQALGWAKDVAAAGVPEVEDCSGTGLAFCSYNYTSAAGDLSVITAGDGSENGGLPLVSSYGADCR
jgi:hypothetical protein